MHLTRTLEENDLIKIEKNRLSRAYPAKNGCIFPSNCRVTANEDHFLKHMDEVCISYLHSHLPESQFKILAPLGAKLLEVVSRLNILPRNVQVIEVEDDVDDEPDEIQILQDMVRQSENSRKTKSPGIEFVPPRPRKPESKFIAGLKKNNIQVQDLISHQIMNFTMLKDFMLFLIEAEVTTQDNILEEIEAVSSQVSHIFIQSEIFSVKNLLNFKIFRLVWDHYHLLRRFRDHCVASNSSIRYCGPMQVVIMISQFTQDSNIAEDEIANFLSIVAELHSKVDGQTIDQNSIIKEFCSLQNIQLKPFFVPEADHTTFLSCLTCFTFKAFFPSLEDLYEHIRIHHSRKRPGSVGCLKCKQFINATDDEGSLANLYDFTELHILSQGMQIIFFF